VSELDSVGRFAVRADDYAKFRPTYPPVAIDALLVGLGDPRQLRVVDVGAGTGISLRLLRERGCDALGIEPGVEMRAQAVAGGLDVRAGSASETGLQSGAYDLVTAFQAFHWFANPQAVAEFSRILRPGGRLGLAWNHFDRTDPFTEAFAAIHERYGDRTKIAALGVDIATIERVVREGGFRNQRSAAFRWSLDSDLDAMLGRLRSSSSTPREGEAYEAMVREASDLFARFAGARDTVRAAYRTDVYLSEKAV